MLVRDRMTRDLHTVRADMAVADALSLIREKNIRRLPVVDKHGRLIGIVAEKDLLYASPSPATSLSVYEIGYLLSKLKIKEVMNQEVVTISADAPLEEAAMVMVDNKIGALPVMEGKDLAGIITETDIFKALLEMLGGRDPGLRITLSVEDKPGILSQITGTIAGLGGDIIALGTFYGKDEHCEYGTLMIKISGMDKDAFIKAMEEIQAEFIDIREV